MNAVLIPLTRGKFAAIDEADLSLVSGRKWHAWTKNGKYWIAVATVNGKSVKMHRLLMGITDPSILVDHIDGDGLNNRRVSNLRLATKAQNCRNISAQSGSTWSRFIGVYYSLQAKRWTGQICYGDGSRRFSIGLHDTELGAALARDRWAVELHGRFARLNFPENHPGYLDRESASPERIIELREEAKKRKHNYVNPGRRPRSKIAPPPRLVRADGEQCLVRA